MAKNYVGMGDVLSIPANVLSANNAGDLVNVNAAYGVALNDNAANEPNELQIKGTFKLAKATGAGTGGAAGATANVTGANLVTAGSGTRIGIFAAAAADGDALADVILLP